MIDFMISIAHGEFPYAQIAPLIDRLVFSDIINVAGENMLIRAPYNRENVERAISGYAAWTFGVESALEHAREVADE